MRAAQHLLDKAKTSAQHTYLPTMHVHMQSLMVCFPVLTNKKQTNCNAEGDQPIECKETHTLANENLLRPKKEFDQRIYGQKNKIVTKLHLAASVWDPGIVHVCSL